MGTYFRHELKHYITEADYISLRNRLQHTLGRDCNSGIDGSYIVNSLYFDNYSDVALRQKQDGVANREKFRIRYYNHELSYIKLEKKSKVRDLCHKDYAQISLSQAQDIIGGKMQIYSDTPDLLKEFYAKTHFVMLRPKAGVKYRREAFLLKAGNVRITVDSEISTLSVDKFLEPQAGVNSNGRIFLLEVKYDSFIPEHILGILQMQSRRRTAFSKYAVVRGYRD